MTRLRDPRIVIPLVIPLAAVFLLVVAWGIDTALNSGTVARNVTVAGESAGALSVMYLMTVSPSSPTATATPRCAS